METVRGRKMLARNGAPNSFCMGVNRSLLQIEPRSSAVLYGHPRFSGRFELQTQRSLLELPDNMGATDTSPVSMAA